MSKIEETFTSDNFSIIDELEDVTDLYEVKREYHKKKRKKNFKVWLIGLSILFILLLAFLFRPQIILKNSPKMELSYQEQYKEPGAYAKFLFKKDPNVTVEGKIDAKRLGTYKMTYRYQNGLFKLKKVRTVSVVDKETPKIILTGEKDVFVCPNQVYQELGYQAVDNYDGDLTEKVKVKEDKKHKLIRYQVTDSSGNKQTMVRKYYYQDKTAPVLTLKGSSEEVMYVGQTYIEDGYQAIDQCDGDLTSKVQVESALDSSKIGEYVLTYRVVDASFNEAVITRKVIVKNRPVIDSNYGNGLIYLTFDDGPSSSITPKVLDILKEENVKATFFVINHGTNLDYLIKRAYDEGHAIGLHSYSHHYNLVYQSSQAYFQDLQAISNKVEGITGEPVKIMRFPGGGSNTISRRYCSGIMSYLTEEVLNRGYHYFDWNVASGDAGNSKTSSDVYNNVVKGLSHSKTNIVLMHDFENNYKTLNALSDIIHYGKNNGYQFAKIDMSTPMVRHKVAN